MPYSDASPCLILPLRPFGNCRNLAMDSRKGVIKLVNPFCKFGILVINYRKEDAEEAHTKPTLVPFYTVPNEYYC